MMSMLRGDVEKECREEVEMKLKVGHWSVERKCQRGVVIQDGLSCDRWGAQRRLSCTMTIYNDVEGNLVQKRGVDCREDEVEKKYRVGVSKKRASHMGGWSCDWWEEI